MKMIRTLRLLIGTSVRVAPGASLGCLAETAGVLVALSQSWSLALFIDAAAGRDVDRMTMGAALFVAQIAMARMLIVVGMNARMNQLERVGSEFAARIAAITATIPTIDHLDNPEYLDQLHILREQQGAIGLAVNTLLNQLNTLVGVIGVLSLAVAADPRMLLVAVAGVPTMLAGPLVARWQGRAEAAGAAPGRLARSLLRRGIAPEHAGEIRVFQLAGPLRARQQAATRAWRTPMLRLAVQESSLTAATQMVFFGVAGVVIGWLVHDALAGTVGIAAVTLSLLLVTRLQRVSADLRSVISELAEMSRTAGRYLWLLDLAERLGHDHGGAAKAPQVSSGLRLEQVGYRFPGAEHAVLTDIWLDLEPGTVLAVVGENGAGKTTLADIITGIRTPTTGRLLAQDRDLATVDPVARRRQLSGAFQDHVRFEFRVSDTVGVGDLPRRNDSDRVRAAIEDGAAAGVVAAVPGGLQRQLGTSWPDGIELSGGQWQRLAIARSMMRGGPAIRILDEPTAALDAITEHELFGRYAAAARRARKTGTITILVTHRFSTVAAADLIIVLDRGRIVERGTHTELLRARGHYAELYNLQARGYHRDPGKE